MQVWLSQVPFQCLVPTLENGTTQSHLFFLEGKGKEGGEIMSIKVARGLPALC